MIAKLERTQSNAQQNVLTMKGVKSLLYNFHSEHIFLNDSKLSGKITVKNIKKQIKYHLLIECLF